MTLYHALYLASDDEFVIDMDQSPLDACCGDPLARRGLRQWLALPVHVMGNFPSPLWRRHIARRESGQIVSQDIAAFGWNSPLASGSCCS